MSILCDYFPKNYIDNIPDHGEVFITNKAYVNNNPIQGYLHSLNIPLDYFQYEYIFNHLTESNNLMINQKFNVYVNKSCTNIRTIRFDGNASDLQKSVVYENFTIEPTSVIYTLDFNDVSYTIDKIKRSIEQYNIRKESFSNTNYQHLAGGYWLSQNGGYLYVGCQQVLKDFTKILSKNERLINDTEYYIPAKAFRTYTDMDYINKLCNKEVETKHFLMFQIAVESSSYFSSQDILSFVRKYCPKMELQQTTNILV